MDKIADLIILYIVCAASGAMVETGVSMVTAMLISVIFVCVDMFIENKKIDVVLDIIYIIVSFINPGHIFFLPIIMYNELYKERYIAMICALAAAWQSFKLPVIIPAALLSICMAIKMHNLEKYRNKYYQALEYSKKADERIRIDRMEKMKNQESDIKIATLAERNRIAREIHDNVGHMLTRSILQVGTLKIINKDENMAEQLDMLKETLDSAMQSIRKSVHDIKDKAVDFEVTVNGLINEYDNPEITFDNGLTGELSKEIKYCFISVIKEALTNVVKHSNADRVEILLREHPALYQLMIKDNGTGIKGIQGEGIGLMNMRERVEALGGNINISHEDGFEIFISIIK